MTNDIVTRLREHAADTSESWDYTALAFDIQTAADEIERLRKAVTTWIICAERLVESQEGEPYKKALEFYLDCQRIVNETCK